MSAINTASGRPNVLIVLADQWRAEALGCTGNTQVDTSAIDRLAAEGALIERAYSTDPVCTPARATLLTGRYPHTTGTVRNECQLPPAEVGFAEVLTAAGYACGYIGKWHVDGVDRPGFVPPGPRRQGFDAYWAGFNRGHRYWDSTYFRDSPDPIEMAGRYEPEYQTDLAIDFMRRRAAQNERFCLVVSWGPPHTPLNPPPEFARAYQPDSLALTPNVPASEEEEARQQLSGYYGHIAALNAQLARLLDELDTLDIAGDTIVAFTADHGDLIGNHGRYRKGQPLDECCRIPMAWRWPGRIRAGARPDLVCSHVDFAPTLLALCGTAAPWGTQGQELSGSLTGRRKEPGPQTAYVEGQIGSQNLERPEWRALRTSTHWCAVALPQNAAVPELTHLYDMAADPYQQRNLAGDESARDLQEALMRQLLAEGRRAGDPHPALATMAASR